jgi:hypothetical protein
VHHTESGGQALRVSLVKPGAYLSASYQTFNNGENWIPIAEYKIPLEVWATHHVFVDQNTNYDYCYKNLEYEVTNVKQPKVKQWLSRQLKNAKLGSLSC